LAGGSPIDLERGQQQSFEIGWGTAMANYDDFLGYVLGTAIACAAILLAIADVVPQRGVGQIDIPATGRTNAN